MPFRLHDTLSGTEIFLPARTPGETSIYACGPTVYNLIHVGNARPAVVFDVLVRHLRAAGQRVRYVRNFTDVDDKIIRVALENNEAPSAVAERYIDAYIEDVSALNCRRPDAEPRVSEHIGDIVEMVRALVGRGHAYERDGDVYFAVRTFPSYGKLSKRDPNELRAGERVAVDERKDDALDFALWKAAKPHEPAGARWDSPWGAGRPGWHIECSAMARRFLGNAFDLHAGGLDLVFPHHENEIAQSECASGLPFASAWMHNGFVNIAGEKVSKSRLKELGALARHFLLRTVTQSVAPEAVRLWLLGTHYRSPIEFEMSDETPADAPESAAPVVRYPVLEEAEKRVEYFCETKARLLSRIGRASLTPAAPPLGKHAPAALRQRFVEALDADLNTAAALAVLGDAFKRANELCDSNRSDTAEGRALLETIDHMTEVLGVGEGDPAGFLARIRARRVAQRGIDAAEIDRLVNERLAARRAKDFARADALRAELLRRGIEVRDAPNGGSSWKIM